MLCMQAWNELEEAGFKDVSMRNSDGTTVMSIPTATEERKLDTSGVTVEVAQYHVDIEDTETGGNVGDEVEVSDDWYSILQATQA
jgi:hypothetical protein